MWVPRHRNIAGNEKADKLTQEVAFSIAVTPKLLPLNDAKNLTARTCYEDRTEIYQKIQSGIYYKEFLKSPAAPKPKPFS